MCSLVPEGGGKASQACSPDSKNRGSGFKRHVCWPRAGRRGAAVRLCPGCGTEQSSVYLVLRPESGPQGKCFWHGFEAALTSLCGEGSRGPGQSPASHPVF